MEQSIGEPTLEYIKPKTPYEAYLAFKNVVDTTQNQLGTRNLSAFKIDTVEAHRGEINSTTLRRLNDEMAKAHRKSSPTEAIVQVLAGEQGYASDLPFSLLPEAILLSESDDKRKLFIPNPPPDHDYPFQVIEVSGSGVESLPEILTELEIEKICDTYDKWPITESTAKSAITSFVKSMQKIRGPEREALERSILEKIAGTTEIPLLAANLRTSLRSMIDTANNLPMPEEIRQLNKVLPVPIEYTAKDIIEKTIDSETVVYYSPSSGTLQIREGHGQPRDATDLDWVRYAEQVSIGFVESIPTWIKQLVENGQIKEGKTYIPWQHNGPHIFQREILEQINGLASIASPQINMVIKRGIEIKPGAGGFVVGGDGIAERQDTYERTQTDTITKDTSVNIGNESVSVIQVSIPEYPTEKDVLEAVRIIAQSKHPESANTHIHNFSARLRDAAIVMASHDILRGEYFTPFTQELYKIAVLLQGEQDTTSVPSVTDIAAMDMTGTRNEALLFLYGKPFNAESTPIPVNSNCIQTQNNNQITTEYAGVMNAISMNSHLLGGTKKIELSELPEKTEETLLTDPSNSYLIMLTGSWGYSGTT